MYPGGHPFLTLPRCRVTYDSRECIVLSDIASDIGASRGHADIGGTVPYEQGTRRHAEHPGTVVDDARVARGRVDVGNRLVLCTGVHIVLVVAGNPVEVRRVEG